MQRKERRTGEEIKTESERKKTDIVRKARKEIKTGKETRKSQSQHEAVTDPGEEAGL